MYTNMRVCAYVGVCLFVVLCAYNELARASIKATSLISTSSQPQVWLCWAEDLGFLDIANECAQQKTLGLYYTNTEGSGI